MASPDPSFILPVSGTTSPKVIRRNSDHSHSPARHRGNSISSDVETPSRPRLSPTLGRSYNPNDPEHRERQRTMDADMAIQLSRARSNTVVLPSPILSPQPHRPSDDQIFPSLSLHEEQDLNAARMGGQLHDDVGPIPPFHPGPIPDAHLNHLSIAHDPSLLVSLDTNEQDDTAMGALPMYQPTDSGPAFDFATMEEYARQEKTMLGIQTPISPRPGATFHFGSSSSTVLPPLVSSSPEDVLAAATITGGPSIVGPSDFTIPFPLPRVRQRKISQSHPGPRRGKMALFEQTSTPPSSLPFRAPHLAAGTTLSAVPSYDNIPDSLTSNNIPGGAHSGLAAASAPGIIPGTAGLGGMGSGHDRPYRFSFYSNSLSATIHARSLSELPAEGQTFEDLFSGIKAPGAQGSESANTNFARSSPQMSNGVGGRGGGMANVPLSGAGTPVPLSKMMLPFPERQSEISKMSGSTRGINGSGNGLGFGFGGGGGVGGQVGAVDTNTWWLDIQSPTEEEMKLLAKVFSIHPLTTEDILMEETREKIELFRTYYFVCFRSFEQDSYSPTYLEPLNMYIIVFREGILSFHFRPTPHPQNVRRRIKQLKDYISVTSDWISYALIDDITDAFGPLIQSIEYEVDSIDELVLILKEAEQSDMLRRIGTCRKKVMGLLRLMGNKADVVKGLAKRCNENWRVAPTSDIGLYLSDIQDHLITMTQNLNHYEKILSRSHSNYLAQISIEMTDANNQINDVLSKLTALGTVLIPMNLITGLWGMNVHVPGQNGETLTWFGGIIGALAAFAIVAGWSTYKLMVGR